MKVIAYHEYGSPEVLKLEEFPKPVPKDGQILVKIRAASINAADRIMMRGKPFIVRLMLGGIKRPKKNILGGDIAGVIEAVGENGKQFKPGDEVYADILDNKHVIPGGFAEYVSVPENLLALKPSNLSFEEAAAVPIAGLTALQALRKFRQVKPGEKLLIYGASGGVGIYLIQIAKHFGAEVTAVCSTRNIEMARSLGADHVIDYTREDFSNNGKLYDWIIAANGYRPMTVFKRALKPGGIFVGTGGKMPHLFLSLIMAPIMSITGNKKMGNLTAKADQEDLLYLKELFEAGKIKPIIDHIYPLSETAEAFRYLEEQHAQGKVVIKVT